MGREEKKHCRRADEAAHLVRHLRLSEEERKKRTVGEKGKNFSTHACEKKNQIYKRKKREIKKKITESSAGIHPRSVRHAKQGGVMGKHPYCTRAR